MKGISPDQTKTVFQNTNTLTTNPWLNLHPNPVMVMDMEANSIVYAHHINRLIPGFTAVHKFSAKSILLSLPRASTDWNELWIELINGRIPNRIRVNFVDEGKWFLIDFVYQKVDRQPQIGLYWTDITFEEERTARAERWMFRFKRMYDSCPLGIVSSRPDGSLIGNEAFCRWIGYTKEEIKKLNKLDITHPEDLDTHKEVYNDMICHKRSYGVFKKRYIAKDGRILRARVQLSGSYDGHGNLESTMAVIEDVTAQELTQERLRQSLNLLESIFDNSPVGINFTSPSGRYLKINTRFAEMLGAEPNDVIGAHYKDFTDKEDYDKENKLLQDLTEGRIKDYHIRKRYVGKNGKTIWASVSVSEIANDKGAVKFYLSMVKDISKERETENQLRKTITDLRKKSKEVIKYADSNKQLESFAYAASHDLKEPIRTVSSFASLLQRKANDKLSETEAEYLNFIIHGAQNMSQLVEDILCYSRADASAGKKEKVNPKQLIKLILFGISHRINETKAVIKYDDLPDEIYGNRTQLKQLFQNLITNALKFQKPGVPPLLEIMSWNESAHQRFVVADNGIGIPAEALDRIFELFHKLHAKSEYQGTGIGLALCKKIVNSHGGKIWAESISGNGAKFFFTLEKY